MPQQQAKPKGMPPMKKPEGSGSAAKPRILTAPSLAKPIGSQETDMSKGDKLRTEREGRVPLPNSPKLDSTLHQPKWEPLKPGAIKKAMSFVCKARGVPMGPGQPPGPPPGPGLQWDSASHRWVSTKVAEPKQGSSTHKNAVDAAINRLRDMEEEIDEGGDNPARARHLRSLIDRLDKISSSPVLEAGHKKSLKGALQAITDYMDENADVTSDSDSEADWHNAIRGLEDLTKSMEALEPGTILKAISYAVNREPRKLKPEKKKPGQAEYLGVKPFWEKPQKSKGG